MVGANRLTLADIDVVQLYENFSAQGVASLIDHGFCSYENVAEVIRFENLIAPSGNLPVILQEGTLRGALSMALACRSKQFASSAASPSTPCLARRPA